MHRELLEKAHAARVTIKISTRIQEIKLNAHGVEALIDEKGATYTAKIFVDASGVAGVLSRRVGLQDKNIDVAVGLEYNVRYSGPECQSHLFIGRDFRGGYGWIFPLGNSRAILGYGTFHRESNAKLKEMLDNLFEIPTIAALARKDDNAVYGGTIPLTKVKKKFVWQNIVCVGDSVSQNNPLAGEGYRFVLEAGRIAAEHIDCALQADDMDALKGYTGEWNAKFYRSYRWCKLLQRIGNVASANDYASDLIAYGVSKVSGRMFAKVIAGDI